MIIEIPTAKEFSETGLNYLQLAWDIGLTLVRELRDGSDRYGEWDTELSDEYWRLSQPALTNGFALIQQAQEFQLKSKIAAISPFLLLSREARDWPKRCEKEDLPFSAFRMADAADLTKIHDTVATHRLPDDFAEFYGELRRLRNTIMHVGLKEQRIEVARLFVTALRTHGYLFEGASWPRRRTEYVNNDRLAAIYSNDHAGDALLLEFDAIVDLLKPAELKRFFGFDKKARRYICPNCMQSADNERIALAQLRPNTPVASEVFCFLCEETTTVVRKPCQEQGCPSNVVLPDGTCLICW